LNPARKSRFGSWDKRLFGMAATFAALLLAAPAALAQGCPMCRTSAEAAGTAGTRAINLGILVLLIPTLLFFLGVLLFAVLRADTGLEAPAGAPEARQSRPGGPRLRTVLRLSWLIPPR